MQTVNRITTLLISIVLISFLLDKLTYFAIKNIEENVFTGQNVGKFNHYLTVKDTIDLAFYGSSRANHHFNPDMFSENSFNMGMDGRKLAYCWTAIKLLPNNKEQEVIINIDPGNVFNVNYKGEDLNSLTYQFHKNIQIKEELTRFKNKIINPLINFYWCISYNSKLLGIIVNYLKPKYNYKRYNGYDPIVVSETQKSIRRKIFQRNLVDDCVDKDSLLNEPNKLAINYLKLIIEYCNLNNKSLFIVTTPIRNDYCKKDNQRLHQIMDSLSATYWDFTDFFKENEDPDLWKDNTHLSSSGANQFSKYFSSEIKRYRQSSKE